MWIQPDFMIYPPSFFSAEFGWVCYAKPQSHIHFCSTRPADRLAPSSPVWWLLAGSRCGTDVECECSGRGRIIAGFCLRLVRESYKVSMREDLYTHTVPYLQMCMIYTIYAIDLLKHTWLDTCTYTCGYVYIQIHVDICAFICLSHLDHFAHFVTFTWKPGSPPPTF